MRAVVVGAGGTLVLERFPRTLRTVGTTWARRVGVVAEVRQAVVAFRARQADRLALDAVVGTAGA